ncbi:hypothetical protein BO78DRAFT_400630 [Aspergillus sclerotiicarbonarius CBS 121057]|uniref:Uncharacterized protein n=1 Tax=Aspergillus sclerotiicarbonarius (strain CBS 121057 / IBT 28362) TaxID=1448318 RepID=A0A319ENK0_ASPSB|nr:hypothetical protein BO78DRAFT_400630 [Aspergillus sclerotiicarbonarius CBS 121057]
MPRPTSRTTKVLLLLTPPTLLTYTTHRFLSTLEAKYPPADPTTTTSLALRTPSNPTTQHCPEIDVYEARAVPVKALLKRYRHLLNTTSSSSSSSSSNHPTNEKEKTETLTQAWILTFLNSRPLLHEASIFGLFLNKTYEPGDTLVSTFSDPTSTTTTSSPEPLKGKTILNGMFTIESFTPSSSTSPPPNPQSQSQPQHHPTPGLLLSWRIPPSPIQLFEKISKWGYPFRLMSGGRHEISISDVYTHAGEEVVDVRFASAHDYEFWGVEGGEAKDQKMVPRWVGRVHRGYARFLVDWVVTRELGE